MIFIVQSIAVNIGADEGSRCLLSFNLDKFESNELAVMTYEHQGSQTGKNSAWLNSKKLHTIEENVNAQGFRADILTFPSSLMRVGENILEFKNGGDCDGYQVKNIIINFHKNIVLS